MASAAPITDAPVGAPSSTTVPLANLEQLSSLLEQIEGVNTCAQDAMGPDFSLEPHGHCAVFAVGTLVGLARREVASLLAAQEAA